MISKSEAWARHLHWEREIYNNPTIAGKIEALIRLAELEKVMRR